MLSIFLDNLEIDRSLQGKKDNNNNITRAKPPICINPVAHSSYTHSRQPQFQIPDLLILSHLGLSAFQLAQSARDLQVQLKFYGQFGPISPEYVRKCFSVAYGGCNVHVYGVRDFAMDNGG